MAALLAVAFLVAVVVMVRSDGDGARIVSPGGPADGADDGLGASDDQAGSLPDGHVVEVVGVVVRGPLADMLTAEVPSGTVLFPDGRAAELTVVLTASAEAPVGRMSFHQEVVHSEVGEGVVGHRGVCGRGWDDRGRPAPIDACVASEPVGEVPAGATVDVPVYLHGVTDDGRAGPGTYPLVVELDEASTLELTVVLRAAACRRGPATTMVGAPGGGEIVCDTD